MTDISIIGYVPHWREWLSGPPPVALLSFVLSVLVMIFLFRKRAVLYELLEVKRKPVLDKLLPDYLRSAT